MVGDEDGGFGVDDDVDFASGKVPADVFGVNLFELALSPVEVHFHLTLDEELVVLVDYPFSLLVADRNAEVDEVT